MPRSSDVFVQNKQPTYSYVQRSFLDPRTGEMRDPELELVKILARGGTIVQLVGPTKSGKTVATRVAFKDSELVKIGGSQVTDPERLWALVCADLRVQVSKKQSLSSNITRGTKSQAIAKGNVYLAQFGYTREQSQGHENGKTNAIEFIDDIFDLATDALLKSHKILFLDDFHVIPEEQKRLIMGSLKQASEKGVKICFAEVPHYADEPQGYLQDVIGRVSRVEFGYWQQEDLCEIANNGFRALGVAVPKSAVIALALEAGGSPQLMQLLCLGLCERFEIGATRTKNNSIPVNLLDINVICINTLNSILLRTQLLSLEAGSTPDRSPSDEDGKRIMQTRLIYMRSVLPLSLLIPRQWRYP